MAATIVFAMQTCTTTDPKTGLIVRTVEGEPWAADDPFVLAKPELFGDKPYRIRRTVTRNADKPVETATKTPGEKRKVTRADQ
jgi:hypothetical protein